MKTGVLAILALLTQVSLAFAQGSADAATAARLGVAVRAIVNAEAEGVEPQLSQYTELVEPRAAYRMGVSTAALRSGILRRAHETLHAGGEGRRALIAELLRLYDGRADGENPGARRIAMRIFKASNSQPSYRMTSFGAHTLLMFLRSEAQAGGAVSLIYGVGVSSLSSVFFLKPTQLPYAQALVEQVLISFLQSRPLLVRMMDTISSTFEAVEGVRRRSNWWLYNCIGSGGPFADRALTLALSYQAMNHRLFHIAAESYRPAMKTCRDALTPQDAPALPPTRVDEAVSEEDIEVLSDVEVEALDIEEEAVAEEVSAVRRSR